MKKKKVLVFAREAGGASFIHRFLRENAQIYKPVWYAEAGACKVLRSLGQKYRKPNSKMLAQVCPDEVFLSATVGRSFEKQLMRQARRVGIRSISFIDHIWNIWQRFADPRTAKKWVHLPDEIFVFHPYVLKLLRQQGCPLKEIRIAPVEGKNRLELGKLRRKEVLSRLRIPIQGRYVLMISENLFRQSKKWRWDQCLEEDYRDLARMVLKELSDQWYLVIKAHPAEGRDWRGILGKSPRLRIIRNEIDKNSVVDSSDLVVGINSILLLEARRRKKPVLVYNSFLPDVLFST